MNAYDIVGDIHGHAAKLEGLLLQMGYLPQGNGFRAPQGRQLVFLGDLIDRGPQQLRVLEMARAMVESGDAKCIMGNHEFNAIAFATDDPGNPGERLRANQGQAPRCVRNREQHAAFLAEVTPDSAEHRSWIQWFRTLPPFMDLGGIRVVHGCWDNAAVALLNDGGWGQQGPLSEEVLLEVCRTGPNSEPSPMMEARKLLTCGLELKLPKGRFIEDKAGQRRKEVRIANWRHWAEQLHELALVSEGQETQLHGLDWPDGLVIAPIEGAPVFIGHHWFTGVPKLESPKLACLDWSAARQGPLVAYRWDGESELSDAKFAWFGGDAS